MSEDYRLIRAQQSTCPDCDRPVFLLSNGTVEPAFYICFECRFVGRVGVGRVKLEDTVVKPPSEKLYWDFDDAVSYLEHMKHLDGIKNYQIKTGVSSDWQQAISWFERLVREYRHKVNVAEEWAAKAKALHFYQAERIQNSTPYPRCCAPGCGDKIKDDDVLKVIGFVDGRPRYLEECCVENFVHGHPDYGSPVGDLEIINDRTLLRFDPNFHKMPDRTGERFGGMLYEPGVYAVPLKEES